VLRSGLSKSFRLFRGLNLPSSFKSHDPFSLDAARIRPDKEGPCSSLPLRADGTPGSLKWAFAGQLPPRNRSSKSGLTFFRQSGVDPGSSSTESLHGNALLLFAIASNSQACLALTTTVNEEKPCLSG
jgi:hypothetical protein